MAARIRSVAARPDAIVLITRSYSASVSTERSRSIYSTMGLSKSKRILVMWYNLSLLWYATGCTVG